MRSIFQSGFLFPGGERHSMISSGVGCQMDLLPLTSSCISFLRTVLQQRNQGRRQENSPEKCKFLYWTEELDRGSTFEMVTLLGSSINFGFLPLSTFPPNGNIYISFNHEFTFFSSNTTSCIVVEIYNSFAFKFPWKPCMHLCCLVKICYFLSSSNIVTCFLFDK